MFTKSLIPFRRGGTRRVWKSGRMGFKDTMRNWFGASDDVNPDEPVEIGVVPIAHGPVVVARLRDEGFDAVGHDAFNIVSNVSSGYRIVVPQAQSEAAAARLDAIVTE